MTTDPIDHAVYDELAEATGEDFVVELVDTFLLEAPAMLDALEAAAEASDGDAYRRAAHSIKSNAQVFGATELAELAKARELEGPSAEEASRMAALRAAFARSAEALKALQNG